MKSMMKDTLILLAITLLSGLILGAVYGITKEPIERQKKLAQDEACREVFDVQGATISFEEVELQTLEAPEEVLMSLGFPNDTVDRVLAAQDESGELWGYVVSIVSHEGYGGDIRLYLGVTQDGITNGISILEISETPGLGMRAEEVLKPQFIKRFADQFTYTKSGAELDSEIDAISGATITTKAVVNAVNGGIAVAGELLQGGGQNE